MEDQINQACENLSRSCAARYEECEDKIRSAPIASVLFAAAAGYFLNYFPVCILLRLVLRVFLTLLKPAIFIFGAIKLVDYWRTHCRCHSGGSEEDGRDPVTDSPVGPA